MTNEFLSAMLKEMDLNKDEYDLLEEKKEVDFEELKEIMFKMLKPCCRKQSQKNILGESEKKKKIFLIFG